MWIFLWLVLSAILIGATLWSLQILLRQKKAWEVYARNKGLIFKKGTFMGPAEITGVLGDYKVAFFTAERQGQDMRSRRYVTVLEISLNEGLVDGGVAGTKEMIPFMQQLDLLHPYQPLSPKWNKDYFLFIRNDEMVIPYLDDARCEALTALLNTRNADVLIVFNDKEYVLRLETSDPMQNAEKIEKIITRLMVTSDKLRHPKTAMPNFSNPVIVPEEGTASETGMPSEDKNTGAPSA